MTYDPVRMLPEVQHVGVDLSSSFDEWARLGDVSGYMLEWGLPMASAIVVNENKSLLPGKAFVEWVVKERSGRPPDEISEDELRRIVADEQLATFQGAQEIMEAVRNWSIV